MRLRAFYDDACFTAAAQDAFLKGFAAEVANALNIKVELVVDLNAIRTEKHNEMEVRRYICFCLFLVLPPRQRCLETPLGGKQARDELEPTRPLLSLA